MFRRNDENAELFDDQQEMETKKLMADTQTKPAATNDSEANAGSGSSSFSGARNTSNPAVSGSGYRPTSPDAPARNRTPEMRAPAQPAQPTKPVQPAASANTNSPTPLQAAPAATPSNKSAGNRILTVGPDILLKGEIATCDRLVIEGAVDASLNDVHTIEIAEAGSFKGTADVEEAEISGMVDGDMTVRGRLVIMATGKVRGNISYGEIEIRQGGELTGKISTYDESKAAAKNAKKAA